MAVERGVQPYIGLAAAETLVVRGLRERARNAGGRDLERVALAEGDECAADLGAAFVVDAVGVVDEHSQHPSGDDPHVDEVDCGQDGAEHALDVLCDRFCVPHSHMSVSSRPVARTGSGHKKGGSENPPFQYLHLRLRTRANSCTVARPAGPGDGRSELDHDRHRPVVDEFHLHVGAEAAALQRAHPLGRSRSQTRS